MICVVSTWFCPGAPIHPPTPLIIALVHLADDLQAWVHDRVQSCRVASIKGRLTCVYNCKYTDETDGNSLGIHQGHYGDHAGAPHRQAVRTCDAATTRLKSIFHPNKLYISLQDQTQRTTKGSSKGSSNQAILGIPTASPPQPHSTWHTREQTPTHPVRQSFCNW